MKLLIEEGLLVPGENVLTSEYKGANMTASLNPDGRINYTVRACCPVHVIMHNAHPTPTLAQVYRCWHEQNKGFKSECLDECYTICNTPLCRGLQNYLGTQGS